MAVSPVSLQSNCSELVCDFRAGTLYLLRTVHNVQNFMKRECCQTMVIIAQWSKNFQKLLRALSNK